MTLRKRALLANHIKIEGLNDEAHPKWLAEAAGTTIFEGDVVRQGPVRSGPLGERAFGVEFALCRPNCGPI